MSVYERVHDTGVPVPNSHGHALHDDDDDEWETDPEPANLVSEKEQRWGAKHLPQDKKEFQDMRDLRNQVLEQDKSAVQRDYEARMGTVKESYQKPGEGQTTRD
eukprot:CAMPEP_0119131624 /NCGR_PEP_ID=MMETSP1310-20130426/10488_1 /TAXON_ID=464262 /ORGANISM="Genus nov. species nov., Strain RCC2339" /LENGTH=103 /DNA_ID=CAMNT_0007122211 /DNA_START=73 /DNA_END=381 /DNA_ORIENTATION=-